MATHPKAETISRTAAKVGEVIERECGARPMGCPWRAYEERDVIEALDLHAIARTGEAPVAHVASILPLTPSNAVFEAVSFYDRALRRAIARRAEEERAKREAQARARNAERATSRRGR